MSASSTLAALVLLLLFSVAQSAPPPDHCRLSCANAPEDPMGSPSQRDCLTLCSRCSAKCFEENGQVSLTRGAFTVDVCLCDAVYAPAVLFCRISCKWKGYSHSEYDGPAGGPCVCRHPLPDRLKCGDLCGGGRFRVDGQSHTCHCLDEDAGGAALWLDRHPAGHPALMSVLPNSYALLPLEPPGCEQSKAQCAHNCTTVHAALLDFSCLSRHCKCHLPDDPAPPPPEAPDCAQHAPPAPSPCACPPRRSGGLFLWAEETLWAAAVAAFLAIGLYAYCR